VKNRISHQYIVAIQILRTIKQTRRGERVRELRREVGGRNDYWSEEKRRAEKKTGIEEDKREVTVEDEKKKTIEERRMKKEDKEKLRSKGEKEEKEEMRRRG
jgi:hypothetical protein